MISVIIPALNAERHLPATLTVLVPPAVTGIVREVIVVDGGSNDRTRQIAEFSGADIIRSEPSRGSQLAQGAARARFPWLLFLHADAVLEDGWEREAVDFIHRVDVGDHPRAAAAFRFKIDDKGLAPRVLEGIVRARCSLLKVPDGDQGLLVSRRLFDEVGGYKALPVMEDVDIVRRLGRKRIAILRADATISAERYRRDGYLARILRNQTCRALFHAGLPITTISRLYGNANPAR